MAWLHPFILCLVFPFDDAFTVLRHFRAPSAWHRASTASIDTFVEVQDVSSATASSANSTLTDRRDSTQRKSSELQTFFDKAAREDDLFRSDASVAYWRNLTSLGQQENLQLISQFFSSKLPSASPLQRAVWSTFLVRTGYFGVNAVTGNLLAERRGASSMFGEMDISFRIYELIKCYEQELAFIEEGLVKYPWDYIVQNRHLMSPFKSSGVTSKRTHSLLFKRVGD
jgi:hypothetical protein